MEEMIQIPKWQLEKIENTLRMASNALHSQHKETCLDRNICKSWDWVKVALGIHVINLQQ